MKILVVNGPNLNMLGLRERKHYGTLTLAEINRLMREEAEKKGVSVTFFQSNHEGKIIDYLQKEAKGASGILINLGALTHYGYALRDALQDTGLPIVEVHLSDLDRRETFRQIDVLDGIVLKKITGLKEKSYLKGLDILVNYILASQGETLRG